MKFLRHFQTEVDPETPVSEWSLSREGRVDMQKFIRERDFDVERVYTSTEPKAVETAEKLAEESGAELVKTDLLREVDRSGEGFVKDHDRYIELVEDYLTGGEEADWEDQEEARQRFRKLVERAETGSLAVTHGLLLSLNIVEEREVDPVSFWNDLGFGEVVEQDF
jgi:broad specificity phosphatase PhoE